MKLTFLNAGDLLLCVAIPGRPFYLESARSKVPQRETNIQPEPLIAHALAYVEWHWLCSRATRGLRVEADPPSEGAGTQRYSIVPAMKQNDFPDRILNEVAHRPYPLPGRPWVMTQTWHDLLFAHWPVDARALQEKMPPGLVPDRWDGEAWLGVIPFHMTNVAPRGVPALAWVSAFPELNVRTYVTIDDRPGVYFFSLDAGNPLAVAAARALFHLPYFAAAMTVDRTDDWIDYKHRRTAADAPPAEWNARYRATGPAANALHGSLDYFLTERYCLYTVDESFRLSRVDIHHPPWPLQRAEAEIAVNTMADATGIRLPPVPPLLHFARRQDMVAWLPVSVG